MAKGEVAAVDKLVVIGGSAGSIEVLLQLVPALPAPYPHPVVIVVHRKSSNDNILADLFAAKTANKVREIEDKDTLYTGTLYVAPGDYHVLFEKDNCLSLDYSEKVNYSRPSIDVSFQSAAEVFGPRLTCVLLSGANADGADGCVHAKQRGATTIAQSPESADVPIMPRSAITAGAATYVLDVAGIIDYLRNL